MRRQSTQMEIYSFGANGVVLERHIRKDRMPLYEWGCDCGHRESVWASIVDRDGFRPEHDCGGTQRRLPGGTGLLYFEEGRARLHSDLSDKPITSLSQHKRLMRQRGVVEMGDYVPKAVRDNPQSLGMKRRLEKDSKGRWI